MAEAYDGRQVVGMDLHRRRSVLVRMTEDGRKLETARTGNSPAALRAVMTRAGNTPQVVLEAAYGWYAAAGVLQAAGAELHLAHPQGVKAFSYRRAKNERDCRDLADLLRLGRLPETWNHPAAGPGAAGADPVPDQELEAPGLIAKVHQQVPGLLAHPLPRRMSGDPGQVNAAGAVLDEEQHIQARRNTVSTWKKSTAKIAFAWAPGNARQFCPDRLGAGSIPA